MGDECPLIEELKIIFQYKDRNYIILIDDARLFLSPPPHPHNFTYWPSLREIVSVIPTSKEIIVFDDVIYIYDVNHNYKIKTYFQEKVTDRWKNYTKYRWLKKFKKLISFLARK